MLILERLKNSIWFHENCNSTCWFCYRYVQPFAKQQASQKHKDEFISSVIFAVQLSLRQQMNFIGFSLLPPSQHNLIYSLPNSLFEGA